MVESVGKVYRMNIRRWSAGCGDECYEPLESHEILKTPETPETPIFYSLLDQKPTISWSKSEVEISFQL